MGRMDSKSGRFTEDLEINSYNKALAGWQGEWGNSILYFRFDAEHSQMHDVYDEATGIGKQYHPPIPVPVLHINHFEIGVETNLEGQYFVDSAHVTMSFDQLRRAGLTFFDVKAQSYNNDRFVYDQKVFRVTSISILGQVRSRDTIISMDAIQVKPDELAMDEGWAKYAVQGGY